MGIVWGYVADKFGIQRLALMGVVAMGASSLLLGRQDSLWQFYLYYAIFGTFGFGAILGPLFASIGFWFTKNAGLAIGIVAAGGGL